MAQGPIASCMSNEARSARSYQQKWLGVRLLWKHVADAPALSSKILRNSALLLRRHLVPGADRHPNRTRNLVAKVPDDAWPAPANAGTPSGSLTSSDARLPPSATISTPNIASTSASPTPLPPQLTPSEYPATLGLDRFLHQVVASFDLVLK